MFNLIAYFPTRENNRDFERQIQWNIKKTPNPHNIVCYLTVIVKEFVIYLSFYANWEIPAKFTELLDLKLTILEASRKRRFMSSCAEDVINPVIVLCFTAMYRVDSVLLLHLSGHNVCLYCVITFLSSLIENRGGLIILSIFLLSSGQNWAET